jgi:hypothetical protein
MDAADAMRRPTLIASACLMTISAGKLPMIRCMSHPIGASVAQTSA